MPPIASAPQMMAPQYSVPQQVKVDPLRSSEPGVSNGDNDFFDTVLGVGQPEVLNQLPQLTQSHSLLENPSNNVIPVPKQEAPKDDFFSSLANR